MLAADAAAAVDVTSTAGGAALARLLAPAAEGPGRGGVAPGEWLRARELYAARENAPLWNDEGELTPQAAEIVTLLSETARRGLDPGDYDADQLAAELRRLSRGSTAAGPEELARFDLALTIAVARLISDLRLGRIDPRRAGFALRPENGPPEVGSLVAEVATSADPAARIAQLEPQLPVYGALLGALGRFRSLADRGETARLPEMPTLRPGESDPAVPALRRRLAATGELAAASASQPPDSGRAGRSEAVRYDDELVAAVRGFQRRHGLAVDGVVGPRTLAQLRVPMSRRVEQIELALERLRWLPRRARNRVVVVNIPEFRLRAFRRGSAAPALEMEAIVGTAGGRRETPVLAAEMRSVVFRPYWNVPSSITRRELLPRLRHDPGLLARDDFEIVRRGGDETATLLPATAQSLELLASGAARLRQRPGPENALGLVKFVFPNPKQVYMHDTPAKQLFGRARRDFSHGCIRLEDPAGLAAFLLSEQGWTRERVVAAMQGDEHRWVDLADPATVILFYTTVVAEPGGEVHFSEDIYGHDEVLRRLLAEERSGRREVFRRVRPAEVGSAVNR